ncbi:MAG: DsbA family protein [Bradyrhizobium sp.]
MIITRRAFTAALSLTGLAALAGFSPLRLITAAMAQSASDVSKPVSLPDMAIGPADASVTITEYASMTCPHCAAFNAEVFPKIKAAYVDTGKVRYIFREFPLDIKAAAGSMLARCIAKDDASKYFTVVDLLFKQQNDWVMKNTTETLTRIGKQAGLSQQGVEDCLKDQALLDKIAADQKYATEVLKVNSTPTFFINGEVIKGEASFDEFDKKIKSMLKS